MHGVVPVGPEQDRQSRREVLIEQQSHAGRRSGSSRSCTASAA
jgi:hypothetical protein